MIKIFFGISSISILLNIVPVLYQTIYVVDLSPDTITYFVHVKHIITYIKASNHIRCVRKTFGLFLSFKIYRGEEEKGCENFMQGWVTLWSFMMLGNAFIIIRLKVSHYFIAQAVLSLL